MARRGFLSRLTDDSPTRPLSELESIVQNLNALLNTRLGDSISAREFGLADLSDIIHNLPDATQELQRRIRDTIKIFEPRLRSVTVRLTDNSDPFNLCFEISARLVGNEGRGMVRLRTDVHPEGRVQVS